MVKPQSFFIYLALFLATTVLTALLMNVWYRFVLAPLLGILCVLFYIVAISSEDEVATAEIALQLSHGRTMLWTLHFLVLAMWGLIPASGSLYFSDWNGLPPLLLLKGVVSLVYSSFAPGIIAVGLLDRKRQLSYLEIGVFGFLTSVFITSFTSYALYALQYDLVNYTLPVIWILVCILLACDGLSSIRRAAQIAVNSRPSSFVSGSVRNLMIAIVGFLIAAILSVNISWHVLLAGDLWTHAAQTAYFLQNQGEVVYPWIFHFLAVSVCAVSGLPVINVIQLLQFLAVMPVLALYVTVSSFFGREESKIPVLSTLIFATFMGVGWLAYLWVRSVTIPMGGTQVYGVEFIASELTYDILEGLGAYRIALVPASIAITALICGLRLIKGFSLPRPFLTVASFIVTTVMIDSHIFEAGFFTAVIAASAVFLWDSDYRKTLILTGLGSLAGFAWSYLIDSLSPPMLRIFGSILGEIYYSGFEIALLPLAFAFVAIVSKLLISRRYREAPDLIRQFYFRFDAPRGGIERKLINVAFFACLVLGVFFGIYTITAQPFFAWQTASTGSVPWNYYPIRLGISSLFALIGMIPLFLHESDLRRLFELVSLGVVAITVGGLVNFFGLRPQGFGENRILDILWIPVTVLAAYGFARTIPMFVRNFGRTAFRRQFFGVAIILLIMMIGTSSFVVFVDANVENSSRDGLVPTNSDMVVLSYIISHRGSVGYILTSPTLESQYMILKLTLNPPVGYANPFYTPSMFTSTALPELLTSTTTLSDFRVFLTDHDISYLNDNFAVTSWYLGYQPALVDAATSFLVDPQPLAPPTDASSIAIVYNGSTSKGDFYLASAFALANTPYSLRSASDALLSAPSFLVLSDDPVNVSTYTSELSWVKSTGGTLIVASNMESPGLFESQFIANSDGSSTVKATSLSNNAGQSTYTLPYPIDVHERAAANGAVLGSFQANGSSSPLSYQMSLGSGRIILLMLRDYYQFLDNHAFTDVGRTLYRFLPYLLAAAGVPMNL